MASTSKRKGRPLLAAAAGVAFVSFATQQACETRPVGNLRAPETTMPPGSATSDPAAVPSAEATGGSVAAPLPSARGGSAGSAGLPPDDLPSVMPVGNLRMPDPPEDVKPQPSATAKPKPLPPEPKRHPVGNLRPPD